MTNTRRHLTTADQTMLLSICKLLVRRTWPSRDAYWQAVGQAVGCTGAAARDRARRWRITVAVVVERPKALAREAAKAARAGAARTARVKPAVQTECDDCGCTVQRVRRKKEGAARLCRRCWDLRRRIK